MPREDGGHLESLGVMVGQNPHGVNLDENSKVIRPQGEPGYETAQQRAVREVREAKEFFEYQGSFHLAANASNQKGRTLKNTGRFTALGSFRRRDHLLQAGISAGKRSPFSEDEKARASLSLGLGQSRNAGGMSTRRSVSLSDLATRGAQHTGEVNPFVMRMVDRTNIGGIFAGSSHGAPNVARR
eukprot:TRINITY_DN63991_c0_g1_i1.p1 TRINITY_DN63991_c0_g1~~TRINITY_DN63991_c0_g1_i1.p1  ORF type:complete len:185 (+),score=19.89 TRINITY_DN63991_c0_g1_i1:186-740(+)